MGKSIQITLGVIAGAVIFLVLVATWFLTSDAGQVKAELVRVDNPYDTDTLVIRVTNESSFPIYLTPFTNSFDPRFPAVIAPLYDFPEEFESPPPTEGFSPEQVDVIEVIVEPGQIREVWVPLLPTGEVFLFEEYRYSGESPWKVGVQYSYAVSPFSFRSDFYNTWMRWFFHRVIWTDLLEPPARLKESLPEWQFGSFVYDDQLKLVFDPSLRTLRDEGVIPQEEEIDFKRWKLHMLELTFRQLNTAGPQRALSIIASLSPTGPEALLLEEHRIASATALTLLENYRKPDRSQVITHFTRVLNGESTDYSLVPVEMRKPLKNLHEVPPKLNRLHREMMEAMQKQLLELRREVAQK